MTDKKRSLQDKALLVIEQLASDDLCEDIDVCQTIKPADIPRVIRKLNDIYLFAHAVHQGCCYEVHEDWRKKLLRQYRNLHKAGVF